MGFGFMFADRAFVFLFLKYTGTVKVRITA